MIMYSSPYFNSYNPQPSIDRINAQISELENMKKQVQQPITQPTNLTQNFQIAPTNREVIKYATSIDEVQRDLVVGDTPYFSKDMSVVWIKDTKGEVKTYELTEIIPKDEKDFVIENLQMQITELKGMIENAKSNDSTNVAKNNERPANSTKENKSSSVEAISNIKRKSK